MGAKVTSVTTTISESDLFNNIVEGIKLAKIEGLRADSVSLVDELINIKGTYHRVIDIPFHVAVRVVSVVHNIITLKVETLKVLKIGIPKLALSVAGNAMKDKLSEFGISYEDEVVTIFVDKALEKVDFVKVNVEQLRVENGVLALKISNIDADIEKMQQEKKAKELAEDAELAAMEAAKLKKIQEDRDFNVRLASIDRTEDEYSKLRRDIYRKMPDKAQQYYKYLTIIPDIVALGVRTIMDDRVLTKDKIIIGTSMGYILSPIDLIPSKVPVLGQLDDLGLFIFGVNHLLKRIPLPIIVEHWSGDLKTLKFIQDNIDRLLGMFGSGIIDKVYSVSEKALGGKFGSYKDDSFYFRDSKDPYIVDRFNEMKDYRIKKGFNLNHVSVPLSEKIDTDLIDAEIEEVRESDEMQAITDSVKDPLTHMESSKIVLNTEKREDIDEVQTEKIVADSIVNDIDKKVNSPIIK